MTTLYDITDALRQALLTLAEPLPDITDDAYPLALAEREAAEQAVVNSELDLKAKLRAYVALAQELRVQREAREAEIDRIERLVLAKMHDANTRDRNKEAWLMDSAWDVIQQFNVPLPIKYMEFTLGRRKNPPRCLVLDPSLIPEEYQRIVPEAREPDKKKLLADLKDGLAIPGAKLAEGGYALTVR